MWPNRGGEGGVWGLEESYIGGMSIWHWPRRGCECNHVLECSSCHSSIHKSEFNPAAVFADIQTGISRVHLLGYFAGVHPPMHVQPTGLNGR